MLVPHPLLFLLLLPLYNLIHFYGFQHHLCSDNSYVYLQLKHFRALSRLAFPTAYLTCPCEWNVSHIPWTKCPKQNSNAFKPVRIYRVSILVTGITMYPVVQDRKLRVVLDFPLSLTASLPQSNPVSSPVSSIPIILKIHFSISVSAILTWAISHRSPGTHHLWTTLKNFLTSSTST